jgi:predicted GNAT family acetyltransferase
MFDRPHPHLANPPGLSRNANPRKLNQRGRRLSSRRQESSRVPRLQKSSRVKTHRTRRIMSTINHDSNGHQFTTEIDGFRAELDYTLADGVMTITHTGVPQAIGGRGVAAELMRTALKVAGERGWSVNPACSYAAAYMSKHAQAPDKKHMDELLDEALEESFPASDPPSVGASD